MRAILHEHARALMLTEQRRLQLLQLLQRDGTLVEREVADTLGVSEDTIRRDLRELSMHGALLRVHGGALPASPAVVDLEGRAQLSSDEKRVLGRAAAALVEPKQVVLVDGGTTTLELVRALPPQLRATVVTHSPLIAAELITHRAIEVVVIGGRLFKHSGVAVGASAHEQISAIHADTYFMGATGLHPEHGVTTGDLEESHIKRAMMSAAADTVLLATADKLGKVSSYRIAQLEQLTTALVTAAAPKSTVSALRKRGVRVHVCT